MYLSFAFKIAFSNFFWLRKMFLSICVSRFMGSRSHPHRVLCVCVCVSRCLWVCVIEADSRQLRVITVGLYLFLSRSLLCQILAVFAVNVYGPFWFRDSWALLLPGLRSPDLGCPLLPCATRLSPTESSASAYGKLRFCLRKLRLCPTESSASAYGSSASALRKAPFSFSLCITSCNKLSFRNWILPSSLWHCGLSILIICLVALNTELVFLEALKKWFCAFKL